MMKKDNKKTVLFYSSVKTKKMFSIQSYYRNDIMILRDLGYRVRLSKSCWDFVRFWRYSIAFVYFYRYGFFAGMCKLFFLSCVTCCRTGRLLFLLWIVAMWLSYMEEKCHPIVRYVIMWWISNVFFIWEIHQKRKSNIYWWHGCKIQIMFFGKEQIRPLWFSRKSTNGILRLVLCQLVRRGIAAIEALTAGCCLIHSGRGGLKDAAGEMGVQVDIEDMESVTQTCLKLYECPVDQGEIEEGIRFVKERFCYKTRLLFSFPPQLKQHVVFFFPPSLAYL